MTSGYKRQVTIDRVPSDICNERQLQCMTTVTECLYERLAMINRDLWLVTSTAATKQLSASYNCRTVVAGLSNSVE